MKKVIAVSLVFILAVFMCACGSFVPAVTPNNETPGVSVDVSPVPTKVPTAPESTPTPIEEPSAEIVYEAIVLHQDGDYSDYIAEIKNTSSFPIEISDLTIDVEKEDGTLLKVIDYISASPSKIAPGESAFVCERLVSAIDTDIVPSEASVAKLKFDIEKTVMTELDVELVSINLTVRTSFPNIVGKVKNNSAEDISFLFISVPLYSANGVLQTVITGMVDVGAGEEASFDQLGIYADHELDYSDSYLGEVSLYTLW